MTAAECASLLERLQALPQDAPEARGILSELWSANVGLVRKAVHDITGIEYGAPDFEDLTQQAYFGFHAAAYSFRQDGEAAFSTYLASRVKWELSRYYDNSGYTIRIPAFMRKRMKDISQKQKEAKEAGKKLTLSEAARELGYTPKQAEAIRMALERYKVASLEEPIGGEDGDISLLDTVADTSDVEAEAMAQTWQKELHDLLQKALDALPEAQRRVIVRRYYHGVSLPQQARQYGVSRENLYTLQSKGFQRIRGGRYAPALADFAPTLRMRDEWRDTAEREREALRNAADRLALSEKEKGLLIL